MNFKKWKLGLCIALGCGLLNAGAGLLGDMGWKSFVAVLCASLLTNLMNYLAKHPVENISGLDDTQEMKRTLPVILVGCLLLSGCASFQTTQTDERKNVETGEVTKITTQAKSRTFFDSKSNLANFKAKQTEKSQEASVGSLSQEASGTNFNSLIESAVGAAVRAAKP